MKNALKKVLSHCAQYEDAAPNFLIHMNVLQDFDHAGNTTDMQVF